MVSNRLTLALVLAASACARPAPSCPPGACEVEHSAGPARQSKPEAPVAVETLCRNYVELANDQALETPCLEAFAHARERLAAQRFDRLVWCASRARAAASFRGCLDADWGSPRVVVASVTPRNVAKAVAREPSPPQPRYGSADLTEEQKTELARQLYREAEAHAAAGDWLAAVGLYEEAYYLVPGKHGFAHRVGVAAYNAGDCAKAETYLRHFLMYGDHEKQADRFEQAKQILGEISVSGCASR